MRTHMLRRDRAHIPLLDQGLELTAAYFDDGVFAGDKETIQHDERSDSENLAQQHAGRIPVFRDALGQRRESDEMKRQKIHGADAGEAPEPSRFGPATSSTS